MCRIFKMKELASAFVSTVWPIKWFEVGVLGPVTTRVVFGRFSQLKGQPKMNEGIMVPENRGEAIVRANDAKGVLSAHRGIPQIDVSMQLTCYPGSQFPLFGVRLEVPETSEIGSRRTLVEFLFHARSLVESLRTAYQLRPIKCTLKELRPLLLSGRYPVRTLHPDQIRPAPLSPMDDSDHQAHRERCGADLHKEEQDLRSLHTPVLVWEF